MTERIVPASRFKAHRLARLDEAVAAALPGRADVPGDPVDRIICATARAARAQLVTGDRAIRAFDRRIAVG